MVFDIDTNHLTIVYVKKINLKNTREIFLKMRDMLNFIKISSQFSLAILNCFAPLFSSRRDSRSISIV